MIAAIVLMRSLAIISLWEFFADLANPTLSFLPKALLIACMSAIVCGVVGAHVVLRGMAFIGDAVSHAVFPGLAIAFALQGSLLLGGAIAGVTVAVLVTLFSQNRAIKEDSLIGIFFAAAFAVGIVVIARIPGYTGSLQSFLFGSITGVPDFDVAMVAIVGVLIIVCLVIFHRQLVTVSLDRESARAQHLPVVWLDLFLYLAVTAAVVISVKTIGNILVLALLITPAATARLLTNRLTTMMILGPVIGAISAFFGIYGSWALAIPTGASIVLVCSALFIVTWFARLHPVRLAVSYIRGRGAGTYTHQVQSA
ncbi:MAG: anchored repeat-type ABC transporter permease subunit [Actinomycetaceae bacterium]|nr:anchored repeat-type ABC transporter permease subunit [Actinomycetaceae bacterium]